MKGPAESKSPPVMAACGPDGRAAAVADPPGRRVGVGGRVMVVVWLEGQP